MRDRYDVSRAAIGIAMAAWNQTSAMLMHLAPAAEVTEAKSAIDTGFSELLSAVREAELEATRRQREGT